MLPFPGAQTPHQADQGGELSEASHEWFKSVGMPSCTDPSKRGPESTLRRFTIARPAIGRVSSRVFRVAWEFARIQVGSDFRTASESL